MPPKESQDAGGMPDRDQLLQAVAAQQKIAKAQSYAQSLREKASKASNPQERERMLREAYDKEVAAHGNSKFARRLQSGTWQGAAAGGGVGLGTGLGIGTVVGTLVGGIVSIPTTGLGTLIGAGVGAITGPMIKIGGKEKKWEDASPEEVVDVIEQKQATGDVAQPPPTERRKPRKLEVRSSKKGIEEAVIPEAQAEPQQDASVRRPKKLDNRSISQLAVHGVQSHDSHGGPTADISSTTH